MSYLIDTNIICEITQKKPNANVVQWLYQQTFEQCYISVITIGEIRKGIMMLNAGKRKTELIKWLENDIHEWFDDHILGINTQVTDLWGQLNALQKKNPMPAIDSLIAATALYHNLDLVTRNEKNFQCSTLSILNPFI